MDTSYMKKIYSYAMLLLAGTFAMTSCSDDNDSNPTLLQPTAFVLNTPAVSGGTVDLNQSESFELTWSQPIYTEPSAPVVPTYSIQVSTAGTFSQAFDATLDDNTGADYITLDETFSVCKASIYTDALMKAMQQLNNWASDAVPATQQITLRVKSVIKDASMAEYYPILSNTVALTTIPYYYELKNADPEIWYLTGGCIADGSWSNSADAIGTGMTPMFVKPDYEYDKKTGKGEIEYAGYFPDGAIFKIIAPEGLSNWNYGICGGNENGGQVYRDGGDDPGNISVSAGGYYKITLNTATYELTWEKLSGTYTAFTQMAMPGEYQGWDVSNNLMTALTTATENHDWVLSATYATDTSLKFAANGAWDSNWGAEAFPYGVGTNNGPNIPVVAGTYKVFFNDILGTYMFLAQ